MPHPAHKDLQNGSVLVAPSVVPRMGPSASHCDKVIVIRSVSHLVHALAAGCLLVLISVECLWS